MPAAWQIDQWPRCEFHVFLSHCAEDRNQLVVPIFQRLKQQHVIPWIDQHEYPSGREPFEVLREELLRSRHVVYFITSAMLKQGRGWTAVEKAYSSLIQSNLHHGSIDLCHVDLPLFLVPPDHPQLLRSIWRNLIDRGAFFSQRQRQRISRIDWAVEQIVRFVRQEQSWGAQLAEGIESNPKLYGPLKQNRPLIERIAAVHPAPISD